ncbi:Zn(2)-C6 fungal-type domain-containing protein [Pleurotus pulmonarius]
MTRSVGSPTCQVSPLLAVSRLTLTIMNRLNYDYLSSTHGTQQVPRALATQSPSEAFPMSVYSGQNMMLEDDTESTGAFAETVREIEEEFYRTFPAARLPPMVPPSCEWFYDRTTGQYLPQVAREIKDSDYPPCFSEDDSTLVLSHTQREKQKEYEDWGSVPACGPHCDCATQHSHPVATRSNDSSLTKATYSYDTQPNKGAPVHESICASPAVAAVPPHLVVPSQQPTADFSSEIRRQQQWPNHGVNIHNPYPQPVVKAEPSYASHSLLKQKQMPEILSPNSPDSPMTPVYTEHGIAMTVADGHWKYHRYETCVDSSTPSDHGEAHPEWSQYEHGSGSPSRSRRSPSPRLETYPASSCSLEPEMSPAPLSPLSDEKPLEKKPPLACLFCRGRKIACGPPLPGSKDRTCNQCQRRSLKCEYPLESRRGMRKKKVPVATEPPKEAVPDSKSNPVPSVPEAPAPIDQKPILDDVSHRPSEPDVSQQKHPGTHPSSSDGVPIETE